MLWLAMPVPSKPTRQIAIEPKSGDAAPDQEETLERGDALINAPTAVVRSQKPDIMSGAPKTIRYTRSS